METWLYSFKISSEPLINSLIALRDNLVGIFHEATTYAGHPGPQTATTLPPTNHTFSIEGNFLIVVIIYFWEVDMFGFSI